jgi:hypothetical protein
MTLVLLKVIDPIGRERFCAVSSDNTGNTRVGREILTARMPTLLNLPDPCHHINNTWKDIANLPYFTQVNSEHIMTVILELMHTVSSSLSSKYVGSSSFLSNPGIPKPFFGHFEMKGHWGQGWRASERHGSGPSSGRQSQFSAAFLAYASFQ